MEKDLHFCPSAGVNLSVSDCHLPSCAYYDQELRQCRHRQLALLHQVDYRRPADKLAAFAEAFQMSVTELENDLGRIRTITCANLYCQYLFDHSLLDLKTNEIEILLSSESRYEAWPFSNGDKPDFHELCALVTSILPQL